MSARFVENHHLRHPAKLRMAQALSLSAELMMDFLFRQLATRSSSRPKKTNVTVFAKYLPRPLLPAADERVRSSRPQFFRRNSDSSRAERQSEISCANQG